MVVCLYLLYHHMRRGTLAEATVARSSCHLSVACQKRERRKNWGGGRMWKGMLLFSFKNISSGHSLPQVLITEPEMCLLPQENQEHESFTFAKYRDQKN